MFLYLLEIQDGWHRRTKFWHWAKTIINIYFHKLDTWMNPSGFITNFNFLCQIFIFCISLKSKMLSQNSEHRTLWGKCLKLFSSETSKRYDSKINSNVPWIVQIYVFVSVGIVKMAITAASVFTLNFLSYNPTGPVSSNIYRPTINSTGPNLKTTLMTIK